MTRSQSAGASILAVCDVAEELFPRMQRPPLAGRSISMVGPDEAMAWLQRSSGADVVLLADATGRDETELLVQWIVRKYPQALVVAVASKPDVQRAVKLIRLGAADYVPGPLDDQTIDRIILGACGGADRGDRERFFCSECPAGVEFVGQSPAAVEVLRTIRLVAASRCEPVLILGESGVGKELAARAVHWWRFGNFNKFLAVNCATLKANLLESELFGYVKGAFTGADRDSPGLLAKASGGSIFLDEIGEMPPSLQAKLLRLVQEGTYRRVGGTEQVPCKARIIASTNRALLEAVEKGRFRRDLYYRLAVFPIVIPPLRDEQRRQDVTLLAEYFLTEAAGRAAVLSDEARRMLAGYDWPGNVRELRNVVERAAILSGGRDVTGEHIVFDELFYKKRPRTVSTGPAEATGARTDFSLEAAERELIVRALQQTDGKRTQAAALLGITRATLHAKLKKYEIDIPSSHNKKSQANGVGARVDTSSAYTC